MENDGEAESVTKMSNDLNDLGEANLNVSTISNAEEHHSRRGDDEACEHNPNNSDSSNNDDTMKENSWPDEQPMNIIRSEEMDRRRAANSLKLQENPELVLIKNDEMRESDAVHIQPLNIYPSEDLHDEPDGGGFVGPDPAVTSKSSSLLSIEDNSNEDGVSGGNDKAFIWTDTEAFTQQHEQIGASACGATAIINVLRALHFDFDYDTVCAQVKVNLRIPETAAATTTLAQYLFSRSVAGMNATEMIENIERVSDGKITGRLFHFYPPREVNVIKWIAHWIRKGAVPVALLNLQKVPIWGFLPDAWHHQMIYACDTDSIYLTNPLDRKSSETLLTELTSESVLLVRSTDIIKRFAANNTNLVELITLPDRNNREKQRWISMNVLGQVINVLREWTASRDSSSGPDLQGTSSTSPSTSNTHRAIQSTTHVAIPASYVPGITLFAYKDSPVHKEIMETDEIPLATHK